MRIGKEEAGPTHGYCVFIQGAGSGVGFMGESKREGPEAEMSLPVRR